MNNPRLPLLLLILPFSLLFPACGGGAGTPSADTVAAEEETTDEGQPDEGGEPTPQPNALDQQLAPLLSQANASPLPSRPATATALVTLGRALFFDRELSGNRNISCATCHHPNHGTGDGLSLSLGEGGSGLGPARQPGTGSIIPRHAPHLFQLGDHAVLFWDGRVRRDPQTGLIQSPEPALNGANPTAAAIAGQLDSALAVQALFPLTSATEMRGTPGENELADAPDNLAIWEAIMVRLVGENDGTVGGFSGYRQLFQAAYPAVTSVDDFHIGHVGRAIGAFIANDFHLSAAPYDRYLGGELDALSDAQKRGAIVFFGRGRCVQCHGGTDFTDHQFHAIAVPQLGPGTDGESEDLGRFLETGRDQDRYRFKTPGLRNVAVSGPWMHDGAYTSLTRAVNHYDNPPNRIDNYNSNQLAQLFRPLVDSNVLRIQARIDALDGILRNPQILRLNNQERQDLVAFLEALTSPEATDLSSVIPASVPSGLAVER